MKLPIERTIITKVEDNHYAPEYTSTTLLAGIMGNRWMFSCGNSVIIIFLVHDVNPRLLYFVILQIRHCQ